MKKFTTKTDPSTGRYSSFFPDFHHIKYNGTEVGNIRDTPPYKICFMVLKDDINEDGNPNCTWRWIRLKHESNTVKEAKQWVKDNTDMIMRSFKICDSDGNLISAD